MRWIVLLGCLAMAAFLGPAGVAMAAAGVSLDPKPDGTLVLVGSGWRPGQELVVSLGTDTYPATADSSGSFEVPTGLTVSGGPPLSITVRRQDAPAFASAHLGPLLDSDELKNPFAVLFAETLAFGAKFLACTAAGLGLTMLAVRTLGGQARRRSRASR